MVNKNKIKEAVLLLLEGIGEDVSRQGVCETPDRIADMYEELFGGMDKDASEHLQKTFCVKDNSMVMETGITFYSICEHHLIPFFGQAHIAYIPDGKVAGLSKLARTVEVYARRPQLQEQMTAQIADSIMEHLKPAGVMVLIEAEHLCMTMRGVNKPGTKTISIISRGEFEQNTALRDVFFKMIKNYEQ